MLNVTVGIFHVVIFEYIRLKDIKNLYIVYKCILQLVILKLFSLSALFLCDHNFLLLVSFFTCQFDRPHVPHAF